jgi:acyl dehydratase
VVHVDPVKAKSSPFGGTIAHGFLTLSCPSSRNPPEFSDRKMGVNYGLNKVPSPRPCREARIHGRFTLAKYEKIDGNVQTPGASSSSARAAINRCVSRGHRTPLFLDEK